jgi:hypothetical protein
VVELAAQAVWAATLLKQFSHQAIASSQQPGSRSQCTFCDVIPRKECKSHTQDRFPHGFR